MRPNWFVAFPIPAAEWLAEIRADAPKGLRWFHPIDIHLTLAFLGPMNPVCQRAVTELMEQVKYDPISVRFKALMVLPSARNFSAISLSISTGNDAIAQLIEQWRGAFYRIAEARSDTRPPLPHITIARPRRDLSFAQRQEIIAWSQTVQMPTNDIWIDTLALYTWADNRAGRQFKIMYEKRLGD